MLLPNLNALNVAPPIIMDQQRNDHAQAAGAPNALDAHPVEVAPNPQPVANVVDQQAPDVLDAQQVNVVADEQERDDSIESQDDLGETIGSAPRAHDRASRWWAWGAVVIARGFNDAFRFPDVFNQELQDVQDLYGLPRLQRIGALVDYFQLRTHARGPEIFNAWRRDGVI